MNLSRRPLTKRASKAFKARTLPLARRIFVGAPDATSLSSLLVIRTDYRLGNLILMTPFLRRLREALPDARIGMLVGGMFAGLLERWPWVDDWIVQDKRRHILAPWTFVTWISGIRRARWDTAFEMSNHNTHSYYNCVMTLASGAGRRVGFAEPRNQETLTDSIPPPDEFVHFSLAPLDLLRALGLEAPAAPIECPLPDVLGRSYRDWVDTEGLGPSGTNEPVYAVVHMGGRGGKAWPFDAWERFLPHALERFQGRIVIVAGPGELDRLPKLKSADAGRLLIAPPMEIIDLGHLLRGARGFVGCDTGVMHLAAAVGTPTAALFFQSNPWHYAPLGPRHSVALLANPYGVETERWARGVETLERAKLFTTAWQAEASRVGLPASDESAVVAVASAFAAAVVGPNEAHRPEPYPERAP